MGNTCDKWSGHKGGTAPLVFTAADLRPYLTASILQEAPPNSFHTFARLDQLRDGAFRGCVHRTSDIRHQQKGGIFAPTIMWKPEFWHQNQANDKGRGCNTPRGVFLRRSPPPPHQRGT